LLVIPAIDLKDGHCVRLKQGRMDDDTVFSEQPVDVAGQWMQQGARRLHLVDLDGAFAGTPKNADVIHAICTAYPDLPVQIGGGIRNIDTAKAYLDAGVSWVIIGTQAVKEPAFVAELCSECPEQVIVGLDAKEGMVATEGWAEVSTLSAVSLAKQFENTGVSAIVYTDISRDGMMQGVNVEQTAALADAINIPVIASGGVTNQSDIDALVGEASRGISGAIVGRAIYEGTLDLASAQRIADSALAG